MRKLRRRFWTWLELTVLKWQVSVDEDCARDGHRKLRDGHCRHCGRVPGTPSFAGWSKPADPSSPSSPGLDR